MYYLAFILLILGIRAVLTEFGIRRKRIDFDGDARGDNEDMT